MKSLNYLFTALLFITQIASAGVSPYLAYQGVLSDTVGNPRPDGLYVFTFRFYDAETGGAELWSEEKSLYVKNGLFSTFLGNVTPFGNTITFNAPYWLGITVAGALELTPRVPLGSTAYSMRALRADTAEFARGTAGGDLIGTYPSPTVTANAITSDKIADGTIQRVDILPQFKAPYADSADVADTAQFARRANVGGTAGGDLTGTYPNPTIAANTITSEKIADKTIVNNDIRANAAIAGTKISPNFGSQDIFTMGKFGIGTSQPSSRLHVQYDTSHFVGINVSSTAANTIYRNTTNKWTAGLDRYNGHWYLINGNGTDFLQIHQSGIMNNYCEPIYFRKTYNHAISAGRPLYITSAGELGYLSSSIRFKKNVRSLEDYSAKIYGLNPVMFDYKKDPQAVNQFGLIAEEVEKVLPELVSYDDQRKPATVLYNKTIPLLLNELIKMKKHNDTLEDKVFQLEQKIDALIESRE